MILNRFLLLKNDFLLKKIMANAGIILSGGAIASGLNLVSFTLMANRMQATSLAVFALAQTYAMILNDIFNVQTWESLVKFGTTTEQDHKKTCSVVKINCVLDFCSAIVATGMALTLINPVSRLLGWNHLSTGIISLYSITILFNLTSLTVGIPRLFNRFASIAKIQIVVAGARLCVMLGLSFFPELSINPYIIVYLLTDIAANVAIIIFSLSLMQKHYGARWWREPFRISRKQRQFLWWTNLRTILRIPVRHFDMVIISSIMSLELVGVYRVYKEIAGTLPKIGDPVNQAIFPEYSRLINCGNSQDAIRTSKKTIAVMAFVSICIVLPMLLSVRLIVTNFFGATYTGWLPALQALIVFYGISFALIPVNSLFIAAGFAKSSFWVVLFTNSIYLATAYLLGKEIGIYGVVVAYAVQMLLNSGIKVLILNKGAQNFR